MRSVLRFGAHVGRGVRRLTADAALADRRRFPRRVEDLTPQGLSAIIGGRVSTLSPLDATAGTSSRALLALTGDGVPESVFVKMSAGTAGIRMLGELAGLGETEARFYRELAPQLRRGLRRSYGSAFDPLTGRFVVVLEDMTTSSCQFPDTLHPLSTDQMAQVVGVLAHLDASFWGRLPQKPGGSGEYGWLQAPSSDPASLLAPLVMKMSAKRLARSTSIPVQTGRYIWDNFARATAIVDSGPHTVLHGDSHPGNTYFRDGQAGLLDWQVVRRGHPARDLAYAIVLGTPGPDRHGVEWELLDIYREALAAEGGPEFDRDELWTRYRQAVVHPYLSALSTAGLGGLHRSGRPTARGDRPRRTGDRRRPAVRVKLLGAVDRHVGDRLAAGRAGGVDIGHRALGQRDVGGAVLVLHGDVIAGAVEVADGGGRRLRTRFRDAGGIGGGQGGQHNRCADTDQERRDIAQVE